MKLKQFNVIDEEVIYKDQKFNIIRSQLFTPTDQQVSWNYIKAKDGVITLPLDDENNVYLKREWRLNIKNFLWEVPSGWVEEENPTEVQIIAAANRELQEEVGVKSNNLQKLRSVYLSNQITTQLHIFLARNLVISKLKPDEHEYLEVVKYPFEVAYKLLTSNQIPNAQSTLAFLLAKEKLATA